MIQATVCHLLRGIGKGQEVLLGPRVSNSLHNGYYNGPGGKFGQRETALSCLARELREEIGVRIDKKSARLFARVDYYYPSVIGPELKWRVFFFGVTRWVGKPKAVNGFRWVEWFKTNRLPYRRMLPEQRLWLPMIYDLGVRSNIVTGKIFYDETRVRVLESTFRFETTNGI